MGQPRPKLGGKKMSKIDIAIDANSLGAFRSEIRGRVVTPADPTYDQDRRIWNGSIDRSPALIAYCADPADIAAAVRFGRESGLPTAIRSGGHSFPGLSLNDGGLVIDLSMMKNITIDRERSTARVQAGVLLGELDNATQQIGMAVPAGIVTHTGLAGLTLGGGIGWLMRKYGLTVDQLLSVDMITADGNQITASETENPELFWGMRGAGANFGIVTEFTFRLNPVGPMVLAGPVVWAMEDSPEVMRFYREWIRDIPDEMQTLVIHRRAPVAPYIPEELHGRHVVMISFCYAGSIEEGEKVAEPMRNFGKPLLDLLMTKSFIDHQAMLDPGFIPGWWYYFRSCDVAELTDDVIDITVEHALAMKSPINAFPIFHLGGAISRVDENATAFNARHEGHTFNINAATITEEGFEEEKQWSRGLWEALKPYHTSVYVNFLMDEGEERIRQAYGAERYDRLKALKRRYDPDNFFRSNQNIPPN